MRTFSRCLEVKKKQTASEEKYFQGYMVQFAFFIIEPFNIFSDLKNHLLFSKIKNHFHYFILLLLKFFITRGSEVLEPPKKLSSGRF